MLVHTGQFHRFVCFTLKGVALESNSLFIFIILNVQDALLDVTAL
jgi:hypothetical protein